MESKSSAKMKVIKMGSLTSSYEDAGISAPYNPYKKHLRIFPSHFRQTIGKGYTVNTPT